LNELLVLNVDSLHFMLPAKTDTWKL